MQTTNDKKYLEKKLAQITVFQIMLILSLPSYAQIIKKTEVNMTATWIGLSILMIVIMSTYVYKKRLKRHLVAVKSVAPRVAKRTTAA
jgi:multidrug transporter EmrE-like cation transporter